MVSAGRGGEESEKWRKRFLICAYTLDLWKVVYNWTYTLSYLIVVFLQRVQRTQQLLLVFSDSYSYSTCVYILVSAVCLPQMG